mmetsp:Transcript_35832/g.102360  ORF Transcript_35832/g.102360 Transcript_35832/m.102360 type:complete len:301 (-) Transcript_35832:75-977(-)
MRVLLRLPAPHHPRQERLGLGVPPQDLQPDSEVREGAERLPVAGPLGPLEAGHPLLDDADGPVEARPRQAAEALRGDLHDTDVALGPLLLVPPVAPNARDPFEVRRDALPNIVHKTAGNEDWDAEICQAKVPRRLQDSIAHPPVCWILWARIGVPRFEQALALARARLEHIANSGPCVVDVHRVLVAERVRLPGICKQPLPEVMLLLFQIRKKISWCRALGHAIEALQICVMEKQHGLTVRSGCSQIQDLIPHLDAGMGVFQQPQMKLTFITPLIPCPLVGFTIKVPTQKEFSQGVCSFG